jgi:NAD(P)H-hydrate epimerase
MSQQIVREEIFKLLKPIDKNAHKGTNGHGLLFAGSATMPGSAILAAKSALRGGIGKISVHTACRAAYRLPFAVPEAIIHPDRYDDYISSANISEFEGVTAIAIGPGIGKHRATLSLLGNLLDEYSHPVIFDADALNLLSENKTYLSYLPACSILTPHIKEFERLTGKAENQEDRILKLKNFAQKHRSVVILKGANSAVAMPDGNLFFNTTGNAGMATAGSGDVLTGLLLALLARGYTSEITALIGVFVHGLAADIAIQKNQSIESLIASDIIEHFGAAWKHIQSTF